MIRMIHVSFPIAFLFSHIVGLNRGKQENIDFHAKIILNFILILFDEILMIFRKWNVYRFSSSEIVEKQENKNGKQENILFFSKINQEPICNSY